MRTFLFTLLFLVGVQTTLAQKEGKALIDSLYTALPGMKEDTGMVRLLAAINFEMRIVNPREGLKPGLTALHSSGKLNYLYGEGLSHYSLGINYAYMSRFPESVDQLLKAQVIFEKLKDYNLICATYLGLALSYRDLDSTISFKYLLKAKEIMPQSTVSVWKVRNTGNIGNIYRSLNHLDSAGKYLSLQLKLSKDYHLNYEMMLAKNRFGWLYLKRNNLDSAFIFLKTGLDYFKSIGANYLVAENSAILGHILVRIYLADGSHKNQVLREAKVYAEEALQAAQEIGMIEVSDASVVLSDIYKIEGNSAKALDYLQQSYKYKDSILGLKIVNKATFLNWKYEQELKDKQVEVLELRNRQQFTLIIATGIIAVILVIVVLFIISSRKKLKKAYNLVNQQKDEITRVLGELKLQT
ncbi:MAG: hypothetical protein V1733_03375 [bacterium]